MDTKYDIGSGLRALRKECGLSQPQMADLMGVAYRTYHGYESGGRAVPSDKIAQVSQRVAEKYGWIVDINALFEGRPQTILTIDEYVESMDSLLAKGSRFVDAHARGHDLAQTLKNGKAD